MGINGNSYNNGIAFYTDTTTVKSFNYNGNIDVKLFDRSARRKGFISLITKVVNTFDITVWAGYLFAVLSSMQKNVFLRLLPLYIFMLLLLYLIYICCSETSKYHGAEHKTLNAYYNGKPLKVDVIRLESRLSYDCGMNFILFSVFVVLLLFLTVRCFFQLPSIIALPLVIGFNRLYFTKNSFSKILLKPIQLIGLLLQKTLTTREPDKKHIELSIQAIKRLINHEKLPLQNEDNTCKAFL